MEITDFNQFTIIDGEEKEVVPSMEEGFDTSSRYIHKTSFELKDVSVAFANSLRRSFSTMCPTITFDKESIAIETNTTALHNEFLIHRLEFIPIYSDGDLSKETFKLKTYYNIAEGIRSWEFVNEDKVPKFLIDTVKPETILTSNNNMNNIDDITTDSFVIKDGITSLRNEEFFKKDVFTNDPILIDCLKTNLKEDGHRDSLKLSATPTYGIGKENTRNDPTGTVQYNFKLDSDDKIETKWGDKLTYLRKDREINGLKPYTEKEVEKLKKSFNLLDKYRVYKTNDEGQANHFEFIVESIGFMSSNRIIYDAIKHLELSIDDVIHSIGFKKTSLGTYSLAKNYSKKITVSKFKTTNINEGCSIVIKNENHTIGNLIQDKLREKFLVKDNKQDLSKYLKLANYRMDHPTIEEIEVMISIRDNVDNTIIDSFLKEYITDLYGDDADIKINKDNRHLYFSVYLFIQTLKEIKKDTTEFLNLYGNISSIDEASFIVL